MSEVAISKEQDLFEVYETLPIGVQRILESYNEDDWDYAKAEEMLGKLEKVGYTFDYGLCGEPTMLRKIEPIQFDLIIYEKQGNIIAFGEDGKRYEVISVQDIEIAEFLYESFDEIGLDFSDKELAEYMNHKIKTGEAVTKG